MWNRELLARRGVRGIAALLAAIAAASCDKAPGGAPFPKADRAVAPIVGDAFSTEDARDRLGEAEAVIRLAAVKPGMWVADVGAGEGYYTVRLSPVVGASGRVLAEDIMADVRDRLAERVQRQSLDNVAIRLGTPDDPRLPADSFDRIFLVHMYHEVASPYAFLWNMRPALKPGGRVIVVDSNRPVRRHGIPPGLLRCELAALGFDMERFAPIAGGDAYFAAFRAARPRPEPGAIKACNG